MTFLSTLIAVTVASAQPGLPCRAIPGWETLMDQANFRFVVIGEIHGTAEMPQAFADAVCLASRTRQVTVALEFSTGDQQLIDDFLASDGGEQARAQFLSAATWSGTIQDGRTSAAMFHLLDTLRTMTAAGAIKGVRAIQPASFDPAAGPAGYEQAMADLVIAAGRADGMVMVLVGNAHAMQREAPWRPGYLPMAARLPDAETLTVNMVANGGESWNCIGGLEQAITCGPSSSPPPPEPFERGVAPTAAVDPAAASYVLAGQFEANIFIGAAMTASPPQHQERAQGISAGIR